MERPFWFVFGIKEGLRKLRPPETTSLVLVGSTNKGDSMEKAFRTWRHDGRVYLAFPNGNGNVSVMDDGGSFYGSFFDLESFQKWHDHNGEFALPCGTVIRLSTLVK